MEIAYIIIIGILICIIIVLCVKMYYIKKSARQICELFAERLKEDTNTVIDISGHDKDMQRLASQINTQLKELRKEKQRFVQGDTELKNAITNISHDLRTPLTAICGYLDLLAQEDKPPKVEKYLSIIRNRTEAMKQLTEELFCYSIIVSTQENLKPEKINLNEAVEGSLAEFYGVLTRSGITPEIVLPKENVYCMLDRNALSRILSNLLSNAVKYSDGDLSVTLIESGKLTFTNHASNLNEVAVGKLFDRFYTVEAARKSTGLGLAISRTLVEHMGGIIEAGYNDGKLWICIQFEICV